jgi:release factor glutamine methyltransferase
MTLAQVLASAAALGLDRLDAHLLLLHTLGRPQSDRAWLLAHDDDPIDGGAREGFLQVCARRVAGEPLAYIVGSKEFFGLELLVDRRVLVPRPDTEALVDWALELLCIHSGRDVRPRVVDLGTGSGAIALAIKKHCLDAQVEAIDVSEEALAVAVANARALGLDVGFRCASWLAGTTARYDLIASNPPYVAAADPHLAALAHEPLSALASGPDGLDDLRAIVAQAPARLQAGGWLLLEHGWDQAAAVRGLLNRAGLANIASRRDLAGIERCSGGQRLELG